MYTNITTEIKSCALLSLFSLAPCFIDWGFTKEDVLLEGLTQLDTSAAKTYVIVVFILI